MATYSLTQLIIVLFLGWAMGGAAAYLVMSRGHWATILHVRTFKPLARVRFFDAIDLKVYGPMFTNAAHLARCLAVAEEVCPECCKIDNEPHDEGCEVDLVLSNAGINQATRRWIRSRIQHQKGMH